MGSYGGLAPAINVWASYDFHLSTLTVGADGINVVGAYDYNFQRAKDFVGGLKFYFNCWYPMKISDQPGDNIGVTEFSHEQKFIIPDLRRVVPSGTIIVITKNNPDGVKVPVNWLDATDTKQAKSATPMPVQNLSSASGENGSKMMDIPALEIWVPLETPFELSDPLPIGYGYLDLDWDSKALTMLDAGVRGGSIYWKLKGLTVGQTEFIVYGGSGKDIGLWRKAFVIHIFDLKA